MGQHRHSDKGVVNDGRYVAPESLPDAARAFFGATAGLVGAPVFRVRTEPVLHDPRPVKVRVHGKTYHLHRVLHGQVFGCSDAERTPGSILPPTLSLPPAIGITLSL